MIKRNIVGFAGMCLVVGIQVACSGTAPAGVNETSQEQNKAEQPAPSASAPAAAPTTSGTAAPAANGDATGKPGVDGKPGKPGKSDDELGGVPTGDDDDLTGAVGEAGSVSVNEHCCFKGKYLKCPDENACFGGGDVFGCLDSCRDDDATCLQKCVDSIENGVPKGCDANAKPPAGVDCKAGTIDL